MMRGEAEVEHRPAGHTLCPDAPAVRLDKPLGDVEAEADATGLAPLRSVRSPKPLEQRRHLFRQDALTLVRHRYDDITRLCLDPRLDRGARGAVLHRVRVEVGEDL